MVYQCNIRTAEINEFEPFPSTFAVDTAVEKSIPFFTHCGWGRGSHNAIARAYCVRCEGEGSFV